MRRAINGQQYRQKPSEHPDRGLPNTVPWNHLTQRAKRPGLTCHVNSCSATHAWVHAQGTWRWVNEAKPGAQPKWGYVSTVPGDRLTLRVTRDPEPGLAGGLRRGCAARHCVHRTWSCRVAHAVQLATPAIEHDTIGGGRATLHDHTGSHATLAPAASTSCGL